ncbi:restriction endonuclease subunit S [Hoylesella shahii]|uniref:restriction endonuclease subunit S n=1 Tax=Hoylesella shahii TaxID=228603 RepID=UPI0028D85F8D|nr:restriction endonuclease subunit S [Hoylesella shahii]
MDTKKLRQKILDLAIHGKLVPQDPNDEPASVLLERIRAEKERLIKEGKIKRSRKSAKTSDTPHYPQDVPFEVPKGWVWCLLEELAYVAAGSTPNKDAFVAKGIPYIKMYNLRVQKIDFDFHPQYIKREIHEGKLHRSRTEIGDLLMNIVGPPLGKLAVIPSTLPEGNFNQAAVLIRPYHHKELLVKYLFYYLSEMSEINSISTKGSAGQVNISLTQSQNMRIPLPPLAEQQRIVEEIERLFKLIDIIEQGKADLQTTITQTKNKILDLAIHGKLVPQDPNDEPASELLKRINPKAQITCDNGHYAQLPKGWSIYELMDVAKIVTGSTPSKSNLSYYGGNFPLYKPSDLDAGRHTNTASEYLTTKGRDVSRIIPPNSIAICCIGSIGKVGYIEQEGTTNQQINTAIPSLAIFPDYLYHLCTSTYFQNSLMEKSSAVTISIVNKSKMEHIKIPLPPKEEQKRIVVAIDNFFNVLDAVKENL